MKRRPGNGIEGAMVCTSLGSLLRPLFYTLRRPVMREVLLTRIWGVPPAGGLLL